MLSTGIYLHSAECTAHVPVCAGGVRDGAGEAAAHLQAGPRQEGG